MTNNNIYIYIYKEEERPSIMNNIERHLMLHVDPKIIAKTFK